MSASKWIIGMLLIIRTLPAQASELVHLEQEPAVVRCWIRASTDIRAIPPKGTSTKRFIDRVCNDKSKSAPYRLALSYIDQVIHGTRADALSHDFSLAKSAFRTVLPGAQLTPVEVFSGTVIKLGEFHKDANYLSRAMLLPWDGASAEMIKGSIDEICAIKPLFFERILLESGVHSYASLLSASKKRHYFAWFSEVLTLEDLAEIQERELGKRIPLTRFVSNLLHEVIRRRKY